MTDWDNYKFLDIYSIIMSIPPESLDRLAVKWDGASVLIANHATNLDVESQWLSAHWKSPGAAALFRNTVEQSVDGMRKWQAKVGGVLEGSGSKSLAIRTLAAAVRYHQFKTDELKKQREEEIKALLARTDLPDTEIDIRRRHLELKYDFLARITGRELGEAITLARDWTPPAGYVGLQGLAPQPVNTQQPPIGKAPPDGDVPKNGPDKPPPKVDQPVPPPPPIFDPPPDAPPVVPPVDPVIGGQPPVVPPLSGGVMSVGGLPFGGVPPLAGGALQTGEPLPGGVLRPGALTGSLRGGAATGYLPSGLFGRLAASGHGLPSSGSLAGSAGALDGASSSGNLLSGNLRPGGPGGPGSMTPPMTPPMAPGNALNGRRNRRRRSADYTLPELPWLAELEDEEKTAPPVAGPPAVSGRPADPHRAAPGREEPVAEEPQQIFHIRAK